MTPTANAFGCKQKWENRWPCICTPKKLQATATSHAFQFASATAPLSKDPRCHLITHHNLAGPTRVPRCRIRRSFAGGDRGRLFDRGGREDQTFCTSTVMPGRDSCSTGCHAKRTPSLGLRHEQAHQVCVSLPYAHPRGAVTWVKLASTGLQTDTSKTTRKAPTVKTALPKTSKQK